MANTLGSELHGAIKHLAGSLTDSCGNKSSRAFTESNLNSIINTVMIMEPLDFCFALGEFNKELTWCEKKFVSLTAARIFFLNSNALFSWSGPVMSVKRGKNAVQTAWLTAWFVKEIEKCRPGGNGGSFAIYKESEYDAFLRQCERIDTAVSQGLVGEQLSEGVSEFVRDCT